MPQNVPSDCLRKGEVQAALTAGFNAGRKHVKQPGMNNLVDMNGWGMLRNSGGPLLALAPFLLLWFHLPACSVVIRW